MKYVVDTSHIIEHKCCFTGTAPHLSEHLPSPAGDNARTLPSPSSLVVQEDATTRQRPKRAPGAAGSPLSMRMPVTEIAASHVREAFRRASEVCTGEVRVEVCSAT